MRALTAFPLLAICLVPTALLGQANAGADILMGRVTDMTGRPVADAQVGATALGSGVTRSIITDAEGRYKLFFPAPARQYVVLAKRMVAQFRATHDLWAGDPAFAELVERLRRGCPEFEGWWEAHDVRSGEAR